MNQKNVDILTVMIGTAGHVDHGKTALVKLLTGCNTDRLQEEQKRGLSIELGFAPCRLNNNRMVGIIDVPGHLDFIRNMVAGATSMDVLMLVIAADDGVMPQTREHLEIINLLKSPQLMVVITKVDLVDKDMLDLVKEEVSELITEIGYIDVPIVSISNQTGEGIGDVRETLCVLVDKVKKNQDLRAFRMPIERVFSVKGYGTVVTGIPISGDISIGDNITLLSGNKISRVRAIQNYKNEVTYTGANICAAINLPDLDTQNLSKGMMITKSDSFYEMTQFLLVNVKNVNKKYVIPQNTEIRFHHGTATVVGKITFLSGKSLPTNSAGVAKIRLKEPLLLIAGDRFVIRKMSPSLTLGGGIVLSGIPGKINNKTKENLSQASLLAEQGDFFITELLAGQNILFSKMELNKLLHNAKNSEELISNAINGKYLVELGEGTYLVLSRLFELVENLKKRLLRFHNAYSRTWGPDEKEVAKWYDIKEKSISSLFKYVTNFTNELVVRYKRLTLTEFKPSLTLEQMTNLEKLLQYIIESDVNAPALGNLSTTLNIKKTDIKLLIPILIEEDKIISVQNHFISKKIFGLCIEKLNVYFEKNDFLEINTFRELCGTSRNFSVALLEKFDSIGITKRTEQGRVKL